MATGTPTTSGIKTIDGMEVISATDLNSVITSIDDIVGAAPSTLTTTAKTLVGAINELDGIVTQVAIPSTGYTFTPAETSLYAIFTGRMSSLAGAYLVSRYLGNPPVATPILAASSIVVSVSGNSITITPTVTAISAIVKLY